VKQSGSRRNIWDIQTALVQLMQQTNILKGAAEKQTGICYSNKEGVIGHHLNHVYSSASSNIDPQNPVYIYEYIEGYYYFTCCKP
jgi:hypothetical protein